jgi:hypothetical protein
LFEHKGPLVGFSAAGLATIANKAQSLSYGVIDGYEVTFI